MANAPYLYHRMYLHIDMLIAKLKQEESLGNAQVADHCFIYNFSASPGRFYFGFRVFTSRSAA
ncbi:hypothetical protein D3C81_1298310 [compost metagenome]